MREINECTAEVFRRSEKRIKERRRMRNRVITGCIPLFLFITLWSVTVLPAGGNKTSESEMSINGSSIEYSSKYDGDQDINGETTATPQAPHDGLGSLDSFSFSLTWDCYGISSYDSKTGKLVKTTDAADPEDYVTTYRLTPEQKQMIYDLISELNVTSYPDAYDPHSNGMMSSPPMTLILSVNTDTVQKTITAADIALTFKSEDYEGQKFLSVCEAIRDILIETDEWKALPEYEYFYS